MEAYNRHSPVKWLGWRIEVAEMNVMPAGYGVAYWYYDCRIAVCCPLGISWLDQAFKAGYEAGVATTGPRRAHEQEQWEHKVVEANRRGFMAGYQARSDEIQKAVEEITGEIKEIRNERGL